jgi:TamB, inner membrane protein subunit of TAM complex
MNATSDRPKRRGRWLRRIGFALLVLFVLLAVFHRPLFFEGTRYFIVRAAKQQHLDLSYDASGSIFTTLTISNLRGIPTEQGPIQRLEIGTLNLRYSLIGLIRHGLPGLLKLVDIRDAYIEITPAESLPPEKERQPQQFKFPALFPDTLNLENINFITHGPTGNTELSGLFLSLLPDRPGILKIETLDIPGVRRWTQIAGATSFRDRNLIITDLVIGPEISLRKFNLDVSKLSEAELGLSLEGSIFDAPIILSAQVSDLNATNRLNLKAESSALSLQKIWEYFNLTVPVTGTFERLVMTFQGEPAKPSSWVGNADVLLSGASYDRQTLGGITLQLDLADQRAKATVLSRLDQENRIDIEANSTLPETFKDFDKVSATGHLQVFAPDLVALNLPVIGDLSLNTSFRLENRKLSTQSVLDSSSLAFSGTELTETHLRLDLSKDLQQQAEAPLFKDLTSRIEGEIKAVRFQDYVVESVNLALSSSDANVHLERLTLARGANHASLQANYILPADLKSWGREPLEFDLNVDAPNLGAFVAPDSGVTLKGTVKVAGKGSAKDGAYDGSFVIEGRGIETMGMTVRSIDAHLDAAQNQARLSQLQVVFNEKNVIRGEGTMRVIDPFDYSGSLDVQFADLSIFQPLLEQEALAPALGGALNIIWKGTGDLGAPQHTGDVSIDLTRGKFGDLQDLAAHAKGSYSPQFVNVPGLTMSARGLGEALLSLFWKDNRLSIFDISVRQEKLTLVQGSAELPLHLAEVQHPDRLIPNDEPLKLALQTRELDLRKLFTQLGQKKPPVTGIVNLDVNAGGTLDELTAKATLRATRIQSPDASQLDPATISLDLDFQNDRLSLNGSVQQRLIQPLRISGNLPFDIVAFRNNQKIDPQTPLELQVTMPPSSLTFLSTLVPAIRQSRGTAAIDVSVRGTIAQPALSGAITANLSALRFTDPSLPPVADAALQVDFTRDRVNIARCTGRIGGGSFAVTGGIGVRPLDNPTLALRLTTQNALILQNDDLSVRASSDIRVEGPLNAASVTGNVFVTRSAFFRNIDILPIGLPGRPAPQPPAEPVFVSFPNPPLRDWKFDISIRTQDAFLVQSNLANGRITIDLKLGGTGLRPWMDGTIFIEQLLATLPFSRLQIESGFIYFKRDQPFVPILNLRGTSTIRDYNITVYITGPATAPEAIFSSDPPLPQAEIVSLIATGATTEELSRDPNALAGRAAILLFQKIYRSVFSRNKPAPAHDSFLSRVRLDIGTMDPKTGKQAASIGIPLTNQLVLVGGLDVGGNFRGQIKYLVRFK